MRNHRSQSAQVASSSVNFFTVIPQFKHMKFIYSLFLIIFSGKFYNKIRNHPLPGAKAIVYNLVFNCLRYPRKVGGGRGYLGEFLLLPYTECKYGGSLGRPGSSCAKARLVRPREVCFDCAS